VVLPSIRDPRLHLAAVIISIHVLGQIGLQFQVSVVQILAAILTCAVIEVAITLKQTGTVVWPASAMLTGSGVALIFRVNGTENGDYFSTRGWYLFAIVAGLALLSKYLIRFRGSHVFNPSNIGLVAAFILLGSGRVEPLDFWWGPPGIWTVAAYTIILVGGALITARLHLLAMSAAFWVALAAGIGVLAASGHCMTARWSAEPVCGAHFWVVILTSAELLVFLFFMITDPKTIPAGRVGRVVFAVGVGLVATLLIAPQTTEFGAKVALLGALTLMSVARLLFASRLPAPSSDEDRLGAFLSRLTGQVEGRPVARRAFFRGAVIGLAVVLLGTGVVAAGTSARTPPVTPVARAVPRVTVTVDPASLPRVTVDDRVARFSSHLAGSGAQELAATLAENLEMEARALAASDSNLLTAVDSGARFREMQTRIGDGVADGERVVDRYTFESLHLVPIASAEGQASLRMGLEARGSVLETTSDTEGTVRSRHTSPFALTFVLSQPYGTRWLLDDVRPLR